MAAADEAILKRVLPHSIEAEQSVIGSMIMDREAIVVASEIITGEDFYNRQYGVLFETMVELNDSGRPVDLVTLQDKLREKDVPPEISSLEFIRDLITAVPTSANVKYYAGIVAEKSTLRKLIRLNEEIANTCYAGKEGLEEILETTEKKVFDLVQRRNTGDFVPIRQVVMNAMDRIEKASRNKGNVTGIPTGFIDLDYKTAGLQPSDLILIAARPSMGKTAFVLNIAQNVAFKQGMTVAMFSLEMSKEQFVNRLFSLESKVDSQHLRTGNLTDAEWESLIESAGVIGKSNLIIDDTPGITIAELRSKCRKYKLEYDLKLIIIDYLQLMTTGQRSENRVQEMTQKLAEHGISVLHDGTIHDYPAYTGAYDRSEVTIRAALEEYPSIKVIIDLHRDAISSADGSRTAPVAEINGRNAAQFMVITGCDDGRFGNMPEYLENFRLACMIQSSAEKLYPGLARPILFDYRNYNQHISTGSLLIEVGSHANSLDEAVYSGELLGDCMADALLKLSE